MLTSILERYKNVSLEVWCYDFNLKNLEDSFEPVISDDIMNRINFISEKNAEKYFEIYEDISYISVEKNNLSILAKKYSNADVFIPLISYLDEVIGTGKPLYMISYDMFVNKLYHIFSKSDKNNKARAKDILDRYENLARNNCYMQTISEVTRKTHNKMLLKNYNDKKCSTIYLPVMYEEESLKEVLNEKLLRKKFNIDGKYIFYPTQIRPYKNLITIMKAYNEIKDTYNLKIVLTGNIKDDEKLYSYIEENKLLKYIISVKDVSDIELNSLYKYALCVIVPSLHEGGIPLQCIEALCVRTPVIQSKIETLEERLEEFGLNYSNSGLMIFEKNDYKKVAFYIENVLTNDRQKFINKQEILRNKILSYTWQDAASIYYEKIIKRIMDI